MTCSILGGKQATNKDEIRGIHWATWTGVLGPEVNGIWEKYTDTNDINATDAYFGGESVVTGDDFGLVKLFRFPSLKKGGIFVKRSFLPQIHKKLTLQINRSKRNSNGILSFLQVLNSGNMWVIQLM